MESQLTASHIAAVLTLFLILEHTEVAIVAALGNVVFFKCFAHDSARLMGMGAVAETAVFWEMEDLLEVAAYLLGLHVEGAEAFDAGGVD